MGKGEGQATFFHFVHFNPCVSKMEEVHGSKNWVALPPHNFNGLMVICKHMCKDE